MPLINLWFEWLSGIDNEDDDAGYETFNVTYVDPTDYSEANYNYLLFPFLHPFKDAQSNHTEVDEVKRHYNIQ